MSLPRLRNTIAIVALLSIALSVPSFGRQRQHASGLQQDVQSCTSPQTPADIKIEACTRILATGFLKGRILAAAIDYRGGGYLTNGDYERAIADFNEAIRIDPSYWLPLNSRGVAYAKQGKLDLALADFTEAQRLAPDNAGISAELAHVRSDLAAKARSSLQEMSGGDIKALQQRLTGDGCYGGAIDAQPSPALDAAIKACPTQDPILRIEAGRHTADIPSIAADAQCQILATTSLDKTTRIWSTRDGHLLRTLRVPIDKDNGGEGYAVAVSPNGRWVATGGWDAQIEATHQSFVYVFDAGTGALVARPFGFDDVVTSLAFSSDGRWLAVTGGQDRSGVRVYDTSTWQLAMSDLAYGHQEVRAVAFGPDGSLYAAGYDGRLRRYGPEPGFPKEQEVQTAGGSQPATIAADPRGEFVTVGFYDTTALSFFEAGTLRFGLAADTSGVDNGNLSGVAWNSAGDVLFAGGRYRIPHQVDFQSRALRFDRNGRRIGETTVSDDTLTHLSPCGAGAAVSGNGFGLIDRAGKVDWSPTSAVDMRGKVGGAFTISPDAKRIRFGLGLAQPIPHKEMPIVDPVVFDLAQETLDAAPNAIPGFIATGTSSLPIDVSHSFRQGDRPDAAAVEPDRSGYVVGFGNGIRGFAANGSERWEMTRPIDTWGLNISADGRIVVAADGDGTIRWRRWSDGTELLALFVDKADRRWVAWTPKGYYTASPGGEDLIGWEINRGWNQPAEFFPASRFRARFNRPDIVRLVLDTLDEDAAIRQADAASGRSEDTRPLIAQLPPLIRIVDPASGTQVTSGSVTIDYSFRSPSGLPVDRIEVDVDGRKVKEIGLPVRALSGDQETAGSVTVTLGTRKSDVGLIAWSDDRASQAAHVSITWDGAPATTSAMRKLYVLVAGVSAYADPGMRLDFAAKDAADFAKALEAQKGVYYGDVEMRVLTNAEVTRASLTQGLDWLKTVATSPDDVSILFLAGHGLTDAKGTYWFFPADANADDMGQKGVTQEEIRRSLQSLKGKVLWFLDTCHAGAAATRAPADMNVLLNTVTAAENGGIVVFASSTGREVSIESKNLGNGAFTKALVEGIEQGKAAFLHALITTSSLDGFVESRVKELTGDKQTPVMERPPQEPDFTIAQAPK